MQGWLTRAQGGLGLEAARLQCRECAVRLVGRPVSVQAKRHTSSAPRRPRTLTQSLFSPTLRTAPREVTSASQGYLLRAGFVRHYGPGLYGLLPFGHRVISKLTAEVHEAMADIGGQACTMPSLVPSDLWLKSGRWDTMGSELFRLQDRHEQDYCLGPTHEETFTEAASSGLKSWKQLPWRLYQIGPKYRDEARPRYGLIRGREFLMKDMYTFDVDEAAAERTFQDVANAYRELFQRLELPFSQVDADTGTIGGSFSQEFQVLADVGDDEIVSCEICKKEANQELWAAVKSKCTVPECSEASHHSRRGLEIGHAFLLGRKYSEAFGVQFMDASETEQTAVMGCYGIGVSRLMSVMAEVKQDEHGVCWPAVIAPFRVAIIVLNGNIGKRHRDAADAMVAAGEALYDQLEATSLLRGDVILDTSDRSAGTKLAEAALIGYPYCVIVGKRHDPDNLEVKERVLNAAGGHGDAKHLTPGILFHVAAL